MLIGVFGLYAVPVTASRVDQVLPVAGATALLIALTAILAGLALRHRSGALTHLGLLGGLALPMVASWGSPGVIEAGAYLVPVIAAFVAIQRAIGARRVELVASGVSLAYFLAWLVSSPSWPALLAGLAIWLLHLTHATFLARRPPLDRGFDVALLLAAAAAAAALFSAVSSLPYVRIGLFLPLFGYQVWIWRARPRALLALLALSGAALVGPVGLDFGQSAAQALLVSGVPLAFMTAYLLRSIAGQPGSHYDLLATGATLLFVLGWIQLGQGPIASGAAATVIAMASGLWLAVDVAVRRASPQGHGHGWAQVMTVTLLATAAIAALWSTPLPDQTLSLWTALIFIAAGLATLTLGVGTGYWAGRVLGLTVLAVSLIKVIATDVWSLSPGHRIATLIAIGLGLLGASFVYSRHLDGRGSSGPAGPAPDPVKP